MIIYTKESLWLFMILTRMELFVYLLIQLKNFNRIVMNLFKEFQLNYCEVILMNLHSLNLLIFPSEFTSNFPAFEL